MFQEPLNQRTPWKFLLRWKLFRRVPLSLSGLAACGRCFWWAGRRCGRGWRGSGLCARLAPLLPGRSCRSWPGCWARGLRCPWVPELPRLNRFGAGRELPLTGAARFLMSLYAGTCTDNLYAFATYIRKKTLLWKCSPSHSFWLFNISSHAKLVIRTRFVGVQIIPNAPIPSISKECKPFPMHFKQSLCITVNFQTVYKSQKYYSTCSLTFFTKHLKRLL